MDKAIYLIERQAYRKELVANLTQKDLEEWVAEESYTDDYTILKIDASDYNTENDALRGEVGYMLTCGDDAVSELQDDYYVFAFGFVG